MIREYLVLLSWLCTVNGKEGYFWHISDIHYDPSYSIRKSGEGRCRNSKNEDATNNARYGNKMPNSGIYGDYSCDSPWELVQSAAKIMKETHIDGIEFVIWTGDTIASQDRMPAETRLRHMKNVTDLLSQTFAGQFVFPALGHEDANSNLSQLAKLWSFWLPDEALATFKKYGYYTIEQSSKNYQIISLNTNLWQEINNNHNNNNNNNNNNNFEKRNGQERRSSIGLSSSKTEADPANQWQWFHNVLNKSKNAGKAVYIVGHAPPGVDDREIGYAGLSDGHNSHYLELVQHYSDVIKGQFFGHWHSDTFRIFYNGKSQPVSWAMITPSITPYRPGGPNNPGLRLYKFNIDTGQILDYSQYYLNIADANTNDKGATWRLEYNFREYYGLAEVAAKTLHDLAKRFLLTNDNSFIRYYGVNRVSLPREMEEIWGCGGSTFDGICAARHYCAVTKLTPRTYSECVATYAYVFAPSSSSSSNVDVSCFATVVRIGAILYSILNL